MILEPKKIVCHRVLSQKRDTSIKDPYAHTCKFVCLYTMSFWCPLISNSSPCPPTSTHTLPPIFIKLSDQISRSVVSKSLRPHESQHARPPCLSPTLGVHPNLSIESVMPSIHLILCHPLLLLPPIPPSIRVFSNEWAPGQPTTNL